MYTAPERYPESVLFDPTARMYVELVLRESFILIIQCTRFLPPQIAKHYQEWLICAMKAKQYAHRLEDDRIWCFVESIW